MGAVIVCGNMVQKIYLNSAATNANPAVLGLLEFKLPRMKEGFIKYKHQNEVRKLSL